ncbi:MAG: helix-turn-helix domain-containing protein [Candidatus Hodarchaeales archaeon]|jgi:response regulator of citrate/malate metabolism
MARYMDEMLVIEAKEEQPTEGLPQADISSFTNQTDLKVFTALKEHQPATRMELCDKTGIARTTIYDALARLMVMKVVTKYSPPVSKKGRPKVFYRTISE